MNEDRDIAKLRKTLIDLQNEGKISLAYLFGSFAKGNDHKRSDIDLAVYFNTKDEMEIFDLIDRILMSTNRDVEILRLDDDDESPFIIQEALKGILLIEPDEDILYSLADRLLHETESIRFRREAAC